ncbi:hypothetical protein [Candidatus Protochlamydia phocaeensis]|uniref:hypothetical protein n=1 Tax=Candidatus Protochlamydia phocaeensis TaxID=1414722 RepID=UPI0008388040|nr:hypothetical protein [Candidatus Protochlamydia phocaeensis]
MFKSLVTLAACISTALTSLSFADCCQSLELGIGWRRDNLNWKLRHLDSYYVSADVDSHIHFKDVDMYTAHGQAKWVGSEYYIRLSGDYGTSQKGRAYEHFHMNSSLFYDYEPIFVSTSDRIKRRSEAYDFDLAVGYPLEFCNCRLSVVPLIGFSYHRQRLRVKADHSSSHSSSSSSSNYHLPSSFPYDYSGSTFLVDSSNPFGYPSSYSDPFSSPSDPWIPSAIGLSTVKRTSSYRFTWYGFYAGFDMAYALDPCWTLFTEFEGHFLDRCHRKRKSWTGVYFVDTYHRESWAYGFDAKLGTAFSMSNCWYGLITVNYKWWKGHAKRDELHWKNVGVDVGLAYEF